MTNPDEPKGPLERNRSGLRLFIVALVLGMLALAADLTWMVPHQSSISANANPPAAQRQASPTTYFPSPFALQTKDSDPPPARLLSE
jgi:hypothetical protein